MDVEVRAATVDDAVAIARVHADSWHGAYGDGLLPDRYLARLTVGALVPGWRRRLSSDHGRADVIVVCRFGEVVGFATFGSCDDPLHAGFAGEIRMLYVHPHHARRGFGSVLFDAAVRSLERRGYRWLVVWVVEGNVEARRFYRRVGLEPDGGRRRERFEGFFVPVVRVVKPLRPVLCWELLVESR